MARLIIAALLALQTSLPVADNTRVNVATFSQDDLAGWKEKIFKDKTRYELRDGALCADSDTSASARYREINIDLEQTPWLNWNWNVTSGVQARKEKTRSGDDYPARVYVVFSGGLAFWRTQAINYVWSSEQPVGSHWPNPFTGNAQMIAVETGNTRLGEWVSEKRNVFEDYRRLYGEYPTRANAVAIMTDTDNSGGKASACYGDIWFSSN